MKTTEVKIKEPFKDLFRIHDENYNDVLKDMSEHGYDQNEPLLIWEEEDTLIDGHTRLAAAQELCIEEVPELLLSFEDVSDALYYSIKRNANRRNVTKGDRLRLIRIVDNPIQRGGDHCSSLFNEDTKSKDSNLNLCYEEDSAEAKKSAKETAKMIGVGATTVSKIRTILNYGTDETIEAVENEEMSVDAAWKEAKAEKEKILAELKETTTFNRTTDSIEWALWTWNPVTGCKHGCEYCYAREMTERFPKNYPNGFEPAFHKKRLTAPQHTPIPKIGEPGEHNVFVCSMADLFGDWVEDEWIESVFKAIEDAPDWWNFLLLTKNPKRYLDVELPKNCWVGATASNQKQMNAAIDTFTELREKVNNVLFLSCEPLMEEIEADLSCIDWLIIGGRSKSKGMPAGQPEWGWVWKLMQCADRDGLVKQDRVYWKPNLTIKPKGYPK